MKPIASVKPERDNMGRRWWGVWVRGEGLHTTWATAGEAQAEAARINAGGAL